MKWMPEVGKPMNCMLPGELVRAMCIEVVSENVCIAQLSMATPISKTHGYVLNATVPCQRKTDALGQDVWVAVSEAEMRVAEEEDKRLAAERAEEQEKRRAEALAKAPRVHGVDVTHTGD